MREEYRWHDGSVLRLWEGEHQPEYITALPFSLSSLHSRLFLLSITLSLYPSLSSPAQLAVTGH